MEHRPMTVAETRDALIARGWPIALADTLAFVVVHLGMAANLLADIEDPIVTGWSNEVRILADHILTDRRG